MPPGKRDGSKRVFSCGVGGVSGLWLGQGMGCRRATAPYSRREIGGVACALLDASESLQNISMGCMTWTRP